MCVSDLSSAVVARYGEWRMRRIRGAQSFPLGCTYSSVLLRCGRISVLVLVNLVTGQDCQHFDNARYPMRKTMFKRMRTYLIGSVAAAALLTSFAGVASAQDEEHKWTANFGAGFTPLVGALNQRLDNGWNISFGGGYNFSDHFSVGG